MPVEPMPLFRADVLAPRSSGFAVPEYALEARGKLDRWVELYHSPRGQDFKETELRADFITHVFQDILGFTGPVVVGK